MTPAELQAWRKRLGWSEVHAAAVLGVPAQTYRNWEDGRTKRLPGLVATVTRYVERFGPLTD